MPMDRVEFLRFLFLKISFSEIRNFHYSLNVILVPIRKGHSKKQEGATKL